MEEESSIDLREFWAIIKKRWVYIVSITAIAVVFAGILSFFVLKPTYESETTIIIGNAPNQDSQKEQSNSNDIYMYQKLMKTYAAIAKSDSVADKTAQRLGGTYTVKDIQDNLKVSPETDTQILDLKYDSHDANESQKVLNTLSDAFMEESQAKYPTDNIKVLDKAKVPLKPIKPKKKLNIAIAFCIGFLASIGVVFVMEYMDNTIKNEDDVEKYLKLPVIGLIPKDSGE